MLRVERGFSLVEILLATTLAAMLMGAVLTATAALSRDRQRMELAEPAARSTGAFDLLRRDLANGATLVGQPGPGGFVVIGHGGLDASTFQPNGRLCRVAYRVEGGVLTREQDFLDDPIRPDRWREIVGVNVRRIDLTPTSVDGERMTLGEDVEERLRGGRTGPIAVTRVPSRVRVRIDYADGVADREVVVR
jgi:prepilin-type N-terminal cleavage/methylation domain-containing protein